MKTKKRIILVDDGDLFRSKFAFLLEEIEHVELVATVSNGRELIEVLKTTETDIVLLDIKMPLLNGIDTSVFLQEYHPDISVIALAEKGEEALIKHMMDYGAIGYIRKDITLIDLQKAFCHFFEKDSAPSAKKYDMSFANNLLKQLSFFL